MSKTLLSEEVDKEDGEGIPHQTAAVLSMYLALVGKFLSNNRFFPHVSDNQLGYYTGFLDSAFSTGPLLSSVLWARLSDRCGRKKAVMAGLLGTSLISTVFGLSPAYWVAVVIRFFWGAIDSCTVVVKTALGDLAKNPKFTIDKARLFGYIAVCGAIGRTFGSFLGGWLGAVYGGEDNHRNCNEFTRVFCRFPYFLPCLVPALLNALALFLVWLYFPQKVRYEESEQPRISQQRSDRGGTLSLPPLKSSAMITAVEIREESNENEQQGVYYEREWSEESASDSHFDLLRSEEHSHASNSNPIGTTSPKTMTTESKVSCSEIWAEKHLCRAVSVYFLTCFYSSGFNSLLPVWLLTANDGQGHGFDMRVHEIGTVWALVGPVYLVSQMFLYHRVTHWVGFLPSAQTSLFLSAVLTFALPYLSKSWLFGGFEDRSDLSNGQHWRNILVLAAVAGLSVATRVMGIATVNLIISEAASDGARMRATAYGLSNTVGSMGRLLAPSVVCNLFAWIVSFDRHHSSALVNYTVPFSLLSVTALAAALLIRYGFPVGFEGKLREQARKKHAAKGAQEKNIDDESDQKNDSVQTRNH